MASAKDAKEKKYKVGQILGTINEQASDDKRHLFGDEEDEDFQDFGEPFH